MWRVVKTRWIFCRVRPDILDIVSSERTCCTHLVGDKEILTPHPAAPDGVLTLHVQLSPDWLVSLVRCPHNPSQPPPLLSLVLSTVMRPRHWRGQHDQIGFICHWGKIQLKNKIGETLIVSAGREESESNLPCVWTWYVKLFEASIQRN